MNFIDRIVNNKTVMTALYVVGVVVVLFAAVFRINHWFGSVPLQICSLISMTVLFVLSVYQEIQKKKNI